MQCSLRLSAETRPQTGTLTRNFQSMRALCSPTGSCPWDSQHFQLVTLSSQPLYQPLNLNPQILHPQQVTLYPQPQPLPPASPEPHLSARGDNVSSHTQGLDLVSVGSCEKFCLTSPLTYCFALTAHSRCRRWLCALHGPADSLQRLRHLRRRRESGRKIT